MTTSLKTSLQSEITGDGPISEQNLTYICERARNELYDYVIRKFQEAESSGLTQADLARKIGFDPAALSRTLGAPGNWTIGTVAKLLAGICAEELVPYSRPYLNRPPVNYTQADILENASLPPRVTCDNSLLRFKNTSARATKGKVAEVAWDDVEVRASVSA